MTKSQNSEGYTTPITQINVDKKITVISSLFSEMKTNEIVLLQEPLVRKNRIGNVPKSHRQFIPFSKDRARVAILLPNDLANKAMILSTFSTADSIVLRLRINKNTQILLASVYMDITKDIPTDLIHRSARFAESENLPLMVGVDTNAHHTVWGHRSCNQRGRSLLLSLSSNNLILANKGNTPTFRTKVGNSVIDLTFTNILGSKLLSSWRVDTSNSISGHETIRFKLDLGTSARRAIRNPAKCDWGLYQELVESAFKDKPFWFQPVATAVDLNKRQKFIDSILIDSFNKACPLVQVVHKSTAPWWSAELTQAKSKTKSLRRRARKTNLPKDWDNFKAISNSYRALIRKSKREGWKTYTQNISGVNPSARISKILNYNANKSGSLNSVRKPNGNLTSSHQETLETLADTLIPDDGIQEPTQKAPPDLE